jgi:phage shock protein PspC (stress-responsive transcriptional regulator)
MERRKQTLYRDTDDGMIGGVCSGLGRYFDVDNTLVRVAFVVAALLGGGGILGYLILWAVVDAARNGYWDESELDLTEGSLSIGEMDKSATVDVDVLDPQANDAAGS